MASAKYEKVKGYYDAGYWTLAKVLNAVGTGWITEEEFCVITGSTVKECS